MLLSKLTLRDIVLFVIGIAFYALVSNTPYARFMATDAKRREEMKAIAEWIESNRSAINAIENEYGVVISSGNTGNLGVHVVYDNDKKLDEIILKVTRLSISTKCPYKIVYSIKRSA